MQAYEISRTGMDVEWRRLEVIAQNLANANTASAKTGTGYLPLRLISGPAASFAGHMAGVTVYNVAPMNVAPHKVYEPAHPQADKAGFVSYPGIDQASEMTLMLQTSRSYEANVVAMNAARSMYLKALELGGRG